MQMHLLILELFLMKRLDLVSTEEIMDIKLLVCDAEKVYWCLSQIIHLFKWPIYEWHTQFSILLGLWYLATSLLDSALLPLPLFFSCHKEIYKCKLVNSATLDFVLVHSTKILFTPRGLYGSIKKKSWFNMFIYTNSLSQKHHF